MLFEGRIYESNALPQHYLVEYLLITTPLAVLGVAMLGLAQSILVQSREPRSPRSLALLLIQMWLILPLLLYTVQRPNIYDGLRHFLFLLPAVALWYAVGAASLIQRRLHCGPAASQQPASWCSPYCRLAP